MCVYCRKPFGAHPLLQRFTVFQRLKLALPDLTDHYKGAIRTSEPFFFSELQRALADLRRIVLNPNDVGPLRAIDVLNANIAAQNRFTDFSRRAAEFSGPRFMAAAIWIAPPLRHSFSYAGAWKRTVVVLTLDPAYHQGHEALLLSAPCDDAAESVRSTL